MIKNGVPKVLYIGHVTIYVSRPQDVVGFIEVMAKHPDIDSLDWDARSHVIGVRFRMPCEIGIESTIMGWKSYIEKALVGG